MHEYFWECPEPHPTDSIDMLMMIPYWEQLGLYDNVPWQFIGTPNMQQMNEGVSDEVWRVLEVQQS
jgi:hypothetical protein